MQGISREMFKRSYKGQRMKEEFVGGIPDVQLRCV